MTPDAGLATATNGHATSEDTILAVQASPDGRQPLSVPLILFATPPPAGEPCVVEIGDYKTGKPVFRQTGCIFPEGVSDTAKKVIASKYFYGDVDVYTASGGELGPADGGREHSFYQLAERVGGAIADAGVRQGMLIEGQRKPFADTVAQLALEQKLAFNSPVWFNVGLSEAYGLKGSVGNYAYCAEAGQVLPCVDTYARPQASACLPYHARVNTDRGLLPIGDIVFLVNHGETIHTYDAEGSPSRIVAGVCNGRRWLRAVNLADGSTLELTSDHVVFVRQPDDTVVEKEVSQLAAGDALILTRRPLLPMTTPRHDALSPTPEVAWLAGVMVGNGYSGRAETATSDTWELKVNTAAERDRAVAVLAEHGLTYAVKEFHWGFLLRGYGAAGRAFWSRLDLWDKTHAKETPDWVMRSGLDLVGPFLNGLFGTDGSSNQEPNARISVTLSNTSAQVVESAQILLRSMGIFAARSEYVDPRDDHSRKINLTLRIGDQRSIDRFADLVGFTHAEKAEKLAARRGASDADYRKDVVLVTSVEASHAELVYDIQTECASFWYAGVRVHNCFIQSVQDDLQDIMRLATSEAMLFKHGSGTGSDLSTLRSTREKLTGGGRPSGPVSFFKVYDAGAGAIKSGGKCMAPYQPVFTAGGVKTAQALAESGKDFTVLSYSNRLGRVAAKTARAWKSGEKPVVAVVTDKGEFHVSADHPFLLKTGEVVRAIDLKAGLRLFAVSTSRHSSGYVQVGLQDGRKGKGLLHRMVADARLRKLVDTDVVHHGVRGILDSEPDNLTVLTSQAAHAALHSQEQVARGEHVFQRERFPKAGEANGMHASSGFWQSDKADQYRETQGTLLKESGRAVNMQQAARRVAMLNLGYKLINAGHDISTFEGYMAGRAAIGQRVGVTKAKQQEFFRKHFGGYAGFYEELGKGNHRVVEVRPVGTMAVYSIEVDDDEPDDKRAWSEHNYVIAPLGTTAPFMNGVAVLNTRRAARMNTLKVHHPDIHEFINCKMIEEEKARALVAAGYDAHMDGGAYSTVAFQNTNTAIRVTDAFMRLSEVGGLFQTKAVSRTADAMPAYDAKWLLREAAAANHNCGDPGLQYEDTIQRWHTCPNTGPINSSNPCCFVYGTLVRTSEGPIEIGRLAGMAAAGQELPYAFAHDRSTGRHVLRRIKHAWCSGVSEQLVEVTTDKGLTFRCTPEHNFLTYGGEYVEAQALTPGTRLRKIQRHAYGSGRKKIILPGKANTCWQSRWMWEQANGEIPDGMEVHHKNNDRADDRLTNLELVPVGQHQAQHCTGANNPRYITRDVELILDTWDKLTSDGRTTPSSATWNRFVAAQGLTGRVPQFSGSHPKHISGGSWGEFIEWIEEQRSAVNDRVASVTRIEGTEGQVPVFDIEVDDVHNFEITCAGADHGLVVRNSEYMFLDESACNLSSLNLLRFYDNTTRSFDVGGFVAACEVAITAKEILVDHASYPTAMIAQNSHDFRPLGLGYANLGAWLMVMGLPYDSDAGRDAAAIVTALMHCTAYAQSARMAARSGPFPRYGENREPMMRVVRMHAEHAENLARRLLHDRGTAGTLKAIAEEVQHQARAMVSLGEKHGFRNSQVTLLAPTGCATPDTLVLTDQGLRRLGRLGERGGSKWQDVDFRVQTDTGPKRATKFFINGMASVVNVETSRGFRFRATPKHRIKVVNGRGQWVWRRMHEIAEGDVVPLKLGGMIGEPVPAPLPALEPLDPRATPLAVPAAMGRDLAELLGAFMANGSLHEKGIRISTFRGDTALIARTVDLFSAIFGLAATVEDDSEEVVAVTVNSTPLRRWWEAAGFAKIPPTPDHSGKGYDAQVPDAVLETNDPLVYAAFLRGIGDHDGTVAEGCPEIMNKSRDFVADLKAMAMALGFPTTLRSTISGHTGKPLWRARLVNRDFVPLWSELIGFTEERKQEALCAPGAQSGKNDTIYLPREVLDRVCPAGHVSRDAAVLSASRKQGVTRRMASQLFEETRDPELGHYLGFFYDTVASASLEDTPQPTYDLSVPENVTWTGGSFISHNTIAFMMDCDTTGIEPDLALVKFKSLAGGGFLQVVNGRVRLALENLGYAPDEIEAIVRHVEATGGVEGCPFINPRDLAVFDCANPPQGGTRYIHHSGHIRMMGAVQPFLSGAISKCVVGDTVVATDLGLVRIGSLYAGEAPDTFRELDGIRVPVGDGTMHHAASFYYGGVRPTWKVTLSDGRTLTGTAPHRLRFAGPDGLDWKALPDLEVGDFVGLYVGAECWGPGRLPSVTLSPPYGSQNAFSEPTALSPDLGRFLGMLTADGHVTSSNYSVGFTKDSVEARDEFRRLLLSLFGLVANDVDDARRDGGPDGKTGVTVGSKSLVEWLVGVGWSKDHVPAFILSGPREVALAYLSGLYLDGYITKSDDVAIGQALRSLLTDVQLLWDNLGVATYFTRNEVDGVDYPVLHAFGHCRAEMARIIDWLEPHKKERAALVENGEDRRLFPTRRRELMDAVRASSATHEFRSVFDPRTSNLRRATFLRAADAVGLPVSAEEARLHYVSVVSVEYAGEAEVYDLSVPGPEAFVGNGIVNHNTVNLPATATVDDFVDCYHLGWRLGLKAIAIYRDGSKGGQPLTVGGAKADEKEEQPEFVGPKAMRPEDMPRTLPRGVAEKLPDEVSSLRFGVRLDGHKIYLHVGFFPGPGPKRVGELFLKSAKEGSTIAGLLDTIGAAVSLGLQHGVPLETYVAKFVGQRFEPQGFTSDPDVQIAKSIVDWAFRKISAVVARLNAAEALTADDLAEEELTLPTAVSELPRVMGAATGDCCAKCGSPLRLKTGSSCYTCENCGQSSGACG